MHNCKLFLALFALIPWAWAHGQTTITLVDAAVGNGGFEQGSGQNDITDWQVGFGSQEAQRKEDNALTGFWSLVLGKGSGNELGAAINTGHVVAIGDVLDLSFSWLPKSNWTTSDEIAWRLFTTSDNTTSGTMSVIAEGVVSGVSSGAAYQPVSLDDLSGVLPVHEGQDLWLQFIRGNASLSHFARLDAVTLSVVTDPQPSLVSLNDANLGAYYPSEQDALDYSLLAPMHDGVWLAGEGYSSGRVDEFSFVFNGIDTAIEVPNIITDNFSLSFWMKTDASAPAGLQWHSGDGLIDGSVSGENNDLGIAQVASKLAFGIGNPDFTLFSQSDVNDGQWHHIVVQRHRLSGYMALYVDGTREAEAFAQTGLCDASSVLRMGGLLSGDGYFTGSIDDVRIFDQALTESAVQALYQNTGDQDGDGASDLSELMAATDWLNPASKFRPTSIDHDGEKHFRVGLDGRAARTYALQRKNNLDAGEWVDLGVNETLNYHSEITLVDSDPIDERSFYQVSVDGRGPAEEKQPNIIVVIVDDMGWNDLSANPDRDDSYYTYGPSEVYTPNMDRIASKGVVFTNGYVSGPVCSPSRAGWMTGVHQNRWDHPGGWAPGLSNMATLSEMLHSAGYATGRVGKNDYGVNLTSPDSSAARSYPGNHGYDFFLGFSAHAHDFWFHTTGGVNVDGSSAHAGPFQYHDSLADPVVDPGRKAYTGSDDSNNLDDDNSAYYISDLLTDEAIGFIDRTSGGSQPFFLTVSYNAVHHLSPQVPGKYLASEAERLGWASTPAEAAHYDPATNVTNNPSDYSDFYGYWNKVNQVGGASEMRKYYLANLRCLDDNIGRLLDELEAAGIEDDTIIFFFGDNGGPPETGANNGPLAGSKYNVFEGGIRVPFMVSWPAKLPQGEVYPHMVSSLDIVPTCLEVAQSDTVPSDLDGISLVTPLINQQPTVGALDNPNVDDRALFWRWKTTNWAVRKGDWKLIRSNVNRTGTFTNEVYFDSAIVGKKSLFNLSVSPKEIQANDQIGSEPAIAAELENLYQSWVDSL